MKHTTLYTLAVSLVAGTTLMAQPPAAAPAEQPATAAAEPPDEPPGGGREAGHHPLGTDRGPYQTVWSGDELERRPRLTTGRAVARNGGTNPDVGPSWTVTGRARSPRERTRLPERAA
mgnify:CR=1 FL=1